MFNFLRIFTHDSHSFTNLCFKHHSNKRSLKIDLKKEKLETKVFLQSWGNQSKNIKQQRKVSLKREFEFLKAKQNYCINKKK